MIDSYSYSLDFESYTLNLDIDFKYQPWEYNEKIKTEIVRSINAVIEHFDLRNLFQNIELFIALTSDAEIQQLNFEYRGKDKPTNVLSFPAEDLKINKIKNSKINNEFLLLGDIILSYDTIKEEIIAQAKSFEEHFTHLLVHATLHLLGFDHELEKEAEEMEAIEIAILEKLGIKSPYQIN